MSVRTDHVNLIVNVGGDKAKDELNQLRKKAADISAEMKLLKKGTEEYTDKSIELGLIRGEMEKLRSTIGITAMSQKELVAELAKLNAMKGSLTPQTKEFEELSKRATEVKARLEQVRTGVFDMSVAQTDNALATKKQNTQLFGLTQVFRELPGFTYSAQTGILGLSNNLPILADNFKQVAASTNAVTGKVNGTMGALKIFAGSILSFGNIFAIAIGLFTIFSDDIFKFLGISKKAKDSIDDITTAQKALNKALESSEVKSAATNVLDLSMKIDLAKKGIIDKEKVVTLYNDTIGKTTGLVSSLNQAEVELTKNAPEYVRMTLYKTAANLSMEESAKSLLKAEQSRQKELDEFSNSILDATTGQIRSQDQYETEQKRIHANRERRQKDEIKMAEDAAAKQEFIAKTLQEKAAKIAQEKGFNLFEDNKEQKQKKDKSQQKALEELARLKEKILAIREELAMAELSADQAEYARIKLKYEKLLKEAVGYTAQILEIKQLEGEELAQFQKRVNAHIHQEVVDGQAALMDEEQKAREARIKANEDFLKKLQEQDDEDFKSKQKQIQDQLDADIKAREDHDKKVSAGQKALVEESYNLFASIADAKDQSEAKALNRELDANEQKRKSFDKLLARKQISQAQYDKEIAKIDKESNERKKQYAIKEANRHKALAITAAIISTIQGVARSFADYAWPYNLIVGGIIAGAGAVQVANISNQEVPEAERGMLIQGKRHSAGGTLIEAEDGEVILSRKTVQNNPGIVSDLLDSSMNRGGESIFKWSNPSISTERVLQGQQYRSSSTANADTNTAQLMNMVQSVLQSSTNTTETAPSAPVRAYVVLKDVNEAKERYDQLRKNSGLNQ